MNVTFENRLGTLTIIGLTENVENELVILNKKNNQIVSQDDLLAVLVEYLTKIRQDEEHSIVAATILINAKNYLLTNVDTFIDELEQDTGVEVTYYDDSNTFESNVTLMMDMTMVFIANN